MATNIFLGFPPENIKQFIIENYGPKEDPMLKVPLTFTAEEPNATFSLKSNNGPDITLETSPTGEEGSWQPYNIGDEIVLKNVGDKIMFRNSSNNIQVMGTPDYDYYYFDINAGKIAASGNIMFLMDKTGELKDLSGKARCYWKTFYNCTALTQAPLLPATTLEYGCYVDMFLGCINIPEPKYKMPNLTFDEVANAIHNTYIFIDEGIYEVQCSDKILIATFDLEWYQWTITEG